MPTPKLIRSDTDRRPLERLVGYGMAYDDGAMTVDCRNCGADIGERCTWKRHSRQGESHPSRMQKAGNRISRAVWREHGRHENAAFAEDPDAPLWSAQTFPHQCGVLGPHVLTECVPVLHLYGVQRAPAEVGPYGPRC